jgi:hypothetical protein
MSKRRVPKRKEDSFPLALIFVAAGLLIAASIALWFVQNGEFGAGQIGPRLAVNTERIDFGKVSFDKMVRAEFQVTNTGDRSLTLDSSTPVRVVEGC